MYRIEPAAPGQIETVRGLFREYQSDIGIDLCFQNFERELADLPGAYAPPQGALLLAHADHADQPAGIVALRPLTPEIAEMKRLYVRPDHRATGLGRQLAEAVIQAARERGYQALRLDTLPQMQTAIALYRRLGFHQIEPYASYPIPGVLFFQLDL